MSSTSASIRVLSKHAEEIVANQLAGTNGSITYGTNGFAVPNATKTIVPFLYGNGRGIVRVEPAAFADPDCIAQLWLRQVDGSVTPASAQGDDSAAQKLADLQNLVSVTGCSLEFEPSVTFLDRGGIITVSRYGRAVDFGETVSGANLIPPLASDTAWPIQQTTSPGVFVQEQLNQTSFPYGAFSMLVPPTDAALGFGFTPMAALPPALTGIADPDVGVAIDVASPYWLGKHAAWPFVQVEFLAPSGFPADDGLGGPIAIGRFIVRRSFQVVPLQNASAPIPLFQPYIQGLFPLDVETREAVQARVDEMAQRPAVTNGQNSFQKLLNWAKDAVDGAMDTIGGAAVGAASALTDAATAVASNPDWLSIAAGAAKVALTMSTMSSPKPKSKSVKLIKDKNRKR